MVPKLVRVALVATCSTIVVAGGCGDDGGDDDAALGPGAVCPVAPAAIEDVLEATVEVGDDAAAGRCTYSLIADPPAEGESPGRLGARVLVDVRPLEDGDYGQALEIVERRAGPTEALGDGEVAGAERGWVSTVGRAVAVGAADADSLVRIVVLDPTLDSATAREAALRIAGEALR